MPGKILRDPFIGFIFRFMCIFGILIAPWQGWNEFYGQYFREVGQAALNFGQTKRTVVLEPSSEQTLHPNIDSQMTMGNRDLIDARGKEHVERTGLDTRSIGWLPTALTMALILATPIPWQRRVSALIGGMILVQGFIVFSLLSWVWRNSGQLSLANLSPFWQATADELSYTLLNQLGTSFSVPVVIWILVSFRLQDIGNATRPKQRRSEAGPQTADRLLSGGEKLSTTKKDKHHSGSYNRREILSSRLGRSQSAIVGVRHGDRRRSTKATGEPEVGKRGRIRGRIGQVYDAVVCSLPKIQHTGFRFINNRLMRRIGGRGKRDSACQEQPRVYFGRRGNWRRDGSIQDQGSGARYRSRESILDGFKANFFVLVVIDYFYRRSRDCQAELYVRQRAQRGIKSGQCEISKRRCFCNWQVKTEILRFDLS